MPIHRLLKDRSLEPDEVKRLTAAYEQALRRIGLVDRDDPIADMVAKKVIDVAQSGVRAPEDIATLAVTELSDR